MENQHEPYEGEERRKRLSLSEADLEAIKHQLYESIQEDIGRGFSKWAWQVVKKGVSLFGQAVIIMVCAVVIWVIYTGETILKSWTK